LISNQSLADAAADALRQAGRSKAEAHRLRKLHDLRMDAHLAGQNSVDARKSAARLKERASEEAAIEAEYQAILDKAEAEAAMVEWETWRSEEATRRQDRNFIAGQR
jgi:hypothetical protein